VITRTAGSGLLALLAACSASAGTGNESASPAQIVFMMPDQPGVSPPGADNVPWEIAVMNLDGSGRRQLTHDGKFKFLPHFSPDGSTIVYSKYAMGGYGDPNGQPDVFVYDPATGRETQLTFSGSAVQPVWSPDGRRIAFLSYSDGALWIMNTDGSQPTLVGAPSHASDDLRWGDLAWSHDDWMLFSVAQNTNQCFKVRLDKIRPDGSARTPVTDGGPNCTPPGDEQSGDADPGFSADGKTIFSSRGFPVPPAGATSGVERKLLSFSSDAWYPGKPERDLSLPSEPSCIEGVPKGSPDGRQVLLFRMCFDRGSPVGGIYVTDTAGTYRTFVTTGFGPDWNPAYPSRSSTALAPGSAFHVVAERATSSRPAMP
jgi:Tol biopolymer transport system component